MRCYECQEFTFKIAEGIQTEIDGLGDSVKKLSDQFYKLQNVTAAYESIVKDLECRMESTVREQKDRIESIESKLNDVLDLPEIIQQLRDEIDDLRRSKSNAVPMSNSNNDDLTYLRSLQREHNLVVKNIPTSVNENEMALQQIIMKIGAVSGVEINSKNIKSVHRMRSKSSDSREQPTDSPILVKFYDKDDTKANLFMRYIGLIGKKTPLTCHSIGFQSQRRIYIDHHLSPELADIKYKAIALKKANLVKNVIARYNVIKIHVNEEWISINNVQKLNELFPHHRAVMTRKEIATITQTMEKEQTSSRHLTSTQH